MGDARNHTIETSYDGIDVSGKDHSTGEQHAVEPISTTVRMMKKANEEKVFYTLLLAIVIYIATQVWASRDSAQVQPYIDKLQDQKIENIEQNVGEIKQDVKTLLRRRDDAL